MLGPVEQDDSETYAYPTGCETKPSPPSEAYINHLVAKDTKYKTEKKLLKILYDLDDSLLEDSLFSLKIEPTEALIEEFKREAETITGNKKFKKSQIVVLGRGWVKARGRLWGCDPGPGA